jgi:hypothetical protein
MVFIATAERRLSFSGSPVFGFTSKRGKLLLEMSRRMRTNPNGATGSHNTGIGANALNSYLTGSNNTASGYQALYLDTTGTHRSVTV